MKDLQKLLASNSPLSSMYNQLHIEPWYNQGDLKTFIETNGKTINDTIMRGCIFQVIYSLCAIQQLFPSFRHNDLSPGNVFMIDFGQPLPVSYSAFGTKYHLELSGPTCPFVVLGDYDFATVSEHPVLTNVEIGQTWLHE